MKKQERKEAYSKIIRLMLSNKNKEAFNALKQLCNADTGRLFLANYDQVMKDTKAKA